MTLEEALVTVWRAALVENSREVELNGQSFSVRTTPKKRLREVDFVFDGNCAAWSKIRKPGRVGRNWPRRAQGHAVSLRPPLRRQRHGLQSHLVWRKAEQPEVALLRNSCSLCCWSLDGARMKPKSSSRIQRPEEVRPQKSKWNLTN